jgi:hypothetical protein
VSTFRNDSTAAGVLALGSKTLRRLVSVTLHGDDLRRYANWTVSHRDGARNRGSCLRMETKPCKTCTPFPMQQKHKKKKKKIAIFENRFVSRMGTCWCSRASLAASLCSVLVGVRLSSSSATKRRFSPTPPPSFCAVTDRITDSKVTKIELLSREKNIC